MPDGTYNKSLFSKYLEDSIIEKVRQNADGQNEAIPQKIRNDFHTALTANIDCHRQLADAAKQLNS